MRLAALAAHNFRCLQAYSIEPHPRLNLFTGPNASGKTSFLESAFMLGRARSFRAATGPELAGTAGNRWSVRGVVEYRGARRPPDRLGVDWDGQGSRLLRNDQPIGRADLLECLPIQVIDPAQHRLLEDGPSYRRRYLDWGVFHVEHRFLDAWRRYERVLRQRNRALKLGQDARLVVAWDRELAAFGEQVGVFRASYLHRLLPRLQSFIEDLLGVGGWTVQLQPGWRAGETLAEALDRGRERDRRQRQTVEGPHRAELRIRLGEHAVRNRVSRGQQKMLVAALVLAQAGLIEEVSGTAPVLLFDDFTAELGGDYQARLIEVLRAYSGQLFVTALEPVPGFAAVSSVRMFHVEHGRLRPA